MRRTCIGGRASARAGAITLAVRGVAKEGTSFDHALGRVRIAWIIAFSRSGRVPTHVFTCGLNVGIDPVPVATPLPDVAGHVVQAVAIWREGTHRRSTHKAHLRHCRGPGTLPATYLPCTDRLAGSRHPRRSALIPARPGRRIPTRLP